MFSSIKMEEYMEYMEAFWHFSSRTSHQKYTAWVPGDPIYANEG